MSRKAKYEPLTLKDGRKVVFGFKERKGVFYVRFPDPADPTKYKFITTEETTEGRAYQRAAQIILKCYMPEEEKRVTTATWETVLADMARSAQLKPRSLEVYTSTVDILKAHVRTTGPGDVDYHKAVQFRNEYKRRGFTKSNKPGANVYQRTPKTIENGIRRMSALWNSYLMELGYAQENPWARVERPDLPETVPTVPTETDFGHYLKWVRDRYPDYEVLHTVVELKMLAGCRLLDVCSILTADLDTKNNTVRIRPEAEKTNKERVIPLPADFAEKLKKIAGPVYLWESYATYRPATPRPGRKNYGDFKPQRLAWTIQEYFDKYNEAHPDRTPITSHDLRRRTVTLLVKATGSVDVAADAVGMSPQTARKHYLDSQKAFDGQKVLRDHADLLRPKA